MRLAILVTLAALFAQGDPGPFRLVDPGPMGRITQKLFEDLDGDGRSEILLFRGKELTILLPDDEGGYRLDAPFVTVLEPDALYFSLGKVDGDERTVELVLVTPRGVEYRTFAKGALAEKSKLLIESESLVLAGQEDDLHWRGFSEDLDGDGRTDIVLATSHGFAIYFQGEPPGVWPKKPDRLVPCTLRGSVTVGPPGLTGRIRGSIDVPDFRVRDFTGDGRADFAVDDGTRLRVFPAGEDGRIAQETVLVIDLAPLTAGRGGLPAHRIIDLNGDGLPDFVVTRQREGITDLFLSGQGLEKPALSVKLDGWSFDPRFSDLDGDGRVDMIIPTTPEVGFTAAMAVTMTGSIKVTSYVFKNTGDRERPYAKKPDKLLEFAVKIRLYVDLHGHIRAAHSVLVDFSGDFDGDGLKDLLYRKGTDEIVIFPGRKEGVFADGAVREIEIPDTEECSRLESLVKDLNGDGRPDVAIFYESRDRRSDRVVLLLSVR